MQMQAAAVATAASPYVAGPSAAVGGAPVAWSAPTAALELPAPTASLPPFRYIASRRVMQFSASATDMMQKEDVAGSSMAQPTASPARSPQQFAASPAAAPQLVFTAPTQHLQPPVGVSPGLSPQLLGAITLGGGPSPAHHPVLPGYPLPLSPGPPPDPAYVPHQHFVAPSPQAYFPTPPVLPLGHTGPWVRGVCGMDDSVVDSMSFGASRWSRCGSGSAHGAALESSPLTNGGAATTTTTTTLFTQEASVSTPLQMDLPGGGGSPVPSPPPQALPGTSPPPPRKAFRLDAGESAAGNSGGASNSHSGGGVGPGKGVTAMKQPHPHPQAPPRRATPVARGGEQQEQQQQPQQLHKCSSSDEGNCASEEAGAVASTLTSEASATATPLPAPPPPRVGQSCPPSGSPRSSAEDSTAHLAATHDRTAATPSPSQAERSECSLELPMQDTPPPAAVWMQLMQPQDPPDGDGAAATTPSNESASALPSSPDDDPVAADAAATPPPSSPEKDARSATDDATDVAATAGPPALDGSTSARSASPDSTRVGEGGGPAGDDADAAGIVHASRDAPADAAAATAAMSPEARAQVADVIAFMQSPRGKACGSAADGVASGVTSPMSQGTVVMQSPMRGGAWRAVRWAELPLPPAAPSDGDQRRPSDVSGTGRGVSPAHDAAGGPLRRIQNCEIPVIHAGGGGENGPNALGLPDFPRRASRSNSCASAQDRDCLGTTWGQHSIFAEGGRGSLFAPGDHGIDATNDVLIDQDVETEEYDMSLDRRGIAALVLPALDENAFHPSALPRPGDAQRRACMTITARHMQQLLGVFYAHLACFCCEHRELAARNLILQMADKHFHQLTVAWQNITGVGLWAGLSSAVSFSFNAFHDSRPGHSGTLSASRSGLCLSHTASSLALLSEQGAGGQVEPSDDAQQLVHACLFDTAIEGNDAEVDDLDVKQFNKEAAAALLGRVINSNVSGAATEVKLKSYGTAARRDGEVKIKSQNLLSDLLPHGLIIEITLDPVPEGFDVRDVTVSESHIAHPAFTVDLGYVFKPTPCFSCFERFTSTVILDLEVDGFHPHVVARADGSKIDLSELLSNPDSFDFSFGNRLASQSRGSGNWERLRKNVLPVV